MKVIVLIVIALIEAASYNLTYQQFLNSTPSQFGVLTVTHARNGNYSYFEKHLDKYASMECPEMMEIAVAWNNDITPEEAGFTKKPTWKRPVHFIKTPYNSMDFRYMLSRESKASVYFSMDDDVVTSCKELRKSFSEWKKHAIGDIAPILSYEPRSFNFEAQNSTYKYIMGKQFPTYFLTLTGVAWIPRTYLELYYSSFELVQELRDLVRSNNNCDDILMNYIANYYFPQFLSRTFNYSLHMDNLPGSQSTTNIHKKIRQGCLERFSQILGFNPLRGVSLHHTDRADLYLSEVNRYALYMRRYEIGQLIEWEWESGEKENFIKGTRNNSTGELIKEFRFKNPWLERMTDVEDKNKTEKNEGLAKNIESIESEEVKNLKEENEKLSKNIIGNRKELEEKDRQIKEQEKVIKDINKEIQEKTKQIVDIDNKNAHLTQKAEEANNIISSNEQTAHQKDNLIQLKDQTIEKSIKEIQDAQKQISEKQNNIQERDRKIEQQNKELEVRQQNSEKLSEHINFYRKVIYVLAALLGAAIFVGILPLLYCLCFRNKSPTFEHIQAETVELIE